MSEPTKLRSSDLTPGTVLEWRGQSRVVLDRRKTEGEILRSGPAFWPGWWLRDNRGGLADCVIDAEDSPWRVVGE